MSDYIYVRFPPERLNEAVNDWAGTAQFLLSELDDHDEEHVIGVSANSVALFEFLLADAGTPIRLSASPNATVMHPDDADPILLGDFGHTGFDYIVPEDVVGIAAALRPNGFDAMVARADPAAMAAAGVRVVPNRGRRQDYDKTQYDDLTRFLAAATADGHGCVTWFC